MLVGFYIDVAVNVVIGVVLLCMGAHQVWRAYRLPRQPTAQRLGRMFAIVEVLLTLLGCIDLHDVFGLYGLYVYWSFATLRLIAGAAATGFLVQATVHGPCYPPPTLFRAHRCFNPPST